MFPPCSRHAPGRTYGRTPLMVRDPGSPPPPLGGTCGVTRETSAVGGGRGTAVCAARSGSPGRPCRHVVPGVLDVPLVDMVACRTDRAPPGRGMLSATVTIGPSRGGSSRSDRLLA